jgi:hypothetical protein
VIVYGLVMRDTESLSVFERVSPATKRGAEEEVWTSWASFDMHRTVRLI